jgi:hypothetical protein
MARLLPESPQELIPPITGVNQHPIGWKTMEIVVGSTSSPSTVTKKPTHAGLLKARQDEAIFTLFRNKT